MLDLNKLSGIDLSKYDFKLMIDKSGSMDAEDEKDNQGKKCTRWEKAHDWSKSIAFACNQFDDDGIDIILFDNTFKVYNNVTDSKVDEIFRKNAPGGSTDTAGALRLTVPEYFKSSSKGFFGFGKRSSEKVVRQKPVIIIVFTDGEPNSEDDLKAAIIEITTKISSRKEIGISFLQVGKNKAAANFLKELDDDLTTEGAAFDIVDTKTYEEVGDMSVEDIFIQALTD